MYSLGHLVWTWSLKFPTKDAYEEFQENFVVALWEVNNNTKFKVKVLNIIIKLIRHILTHKQGEEKEYLINSLTDALSPNDISTEQDDGVVGMSNFYYIYKSCAHTL